MPKPGRTGPERATTSGRSPTIPNEIFLEIFSYFPDSAEIEPSERTRILSRLSSVCTFFRIALRPHRFGRLMLDQRTNSPSAAFCQALVRGDADARALGMHIRNCSILHHGNFGPSVIPTPVLKMYFRALRWAPNIEALFWMLSRSAISIEFWKIISGFRFLKTLEVGSMSFRGNIPAKETDRIAGLRLAVRVLNLTISGSQMFSLPRLLNTTMLSELYCNIGTLDTLLAGGPISSLETLTVGSRSISMQSLMHVLSQVPSVHNFTIYSELFVEESPGAMPRDFSALLPNLSSLACYHPLLAFLAPGRPLVNLNVLDEDSPPLNLSVILRSHGPNITSPGITRLNIPSTIHLTAGHFPQLHRLILGLPPAHFNLRGSPGPETTTQLMELIVDVCDKWAVNPSVQQLRIAAEPRFNPMDLDLVMQHTVLSRSLSQKLPALRWFKLGYRVMWERFALDETWRVFIPIKHRADVIEQFEAGGPSVRDYDGYLQRLSASNFS